MSGEEIFHSTPSVAPAGLLSFYKTMAEGAAMVDGLLGEFRPSEYFSPDLPEGFDTVLGYLAKHEPYTLSCIDQFAEATLRDGWWLTHRCRKAGIKPIKVPASLFLVQQGIFEVNSYPVALLQERFS
jgi:hypothetical protein